jgi:polygalacturonase
MGKVTRRQSLGLAAGAVVGGCAIVNLKRQVKEFDVGKYGAVGDGTTLDTVALQRAVDEAAAAGNGARVLLRGGRKYLTGPVQLKGGIDFHLADDAQIVVSARLEDYPDARDGVLHALNAQGLTISGTGSIDGRSPEFMGSYDAQGEWWVPKKFRPRLFVLEGCKDLEIRDITMMRAPSWTLHLVGCERVLIDRLSIRNQLDVPNCDGIDPDHCQDVEIKNCHIVCGDDAIVIKTTAGHEKYGPSRNIIVRDCVLETQDSGMKIGTETVQDIHDILFERCEVVTGCRGLCIQLRDCGSVYNVVFRDIKFTSRYHSAPWWGRGEAISFTAIPRNAQTQLGTIHDVKVQNVHGRAENSIRIDGHASSRIRDVVLDNVDVTFERWTKYPGGVYDNRPTSVAEPIEKHGTAGISIRHADRVSLKDCKVRWGAGSPDYFTHALEAEDVTELKNENFSGEAAHPERDKAVVMD